MTGKFYIMFKNFKGATSEAVLCWVKFQKN
jgi:hypothetical protein